MALLMRQRDGMDGPAKTLTTSYISGSNFATASAWSTYDRSDSYRASNTACCSAQLIGNGGYRQRLPGAQLHRLLAFHDALYQATSPSRRHGVEFWMSRRVARRFGGEWIAVPPGQLAATSLLAARLGISATTACQISSGIARLATEP